MRTILTLAAAIVLMLIVVSIGGIITAIAVPNFVERRSEYATEVPPPPGTPFYTAYNDAPARTGFRLVVMPLALFFPLALLFGVAFLLRRSSRGAAEGDRQFADGIRELLADLDRFDERIGNLETILIDRPRHSEP
jgi:hypothetical protein